VALLRATARLDKLAKELDEDQRLGVEIIRRACEEPIRWIALNAGHEGSIVAAKVRESKQNDFGFNAATDAYEDLVKAGVIDPTKVVRSALQNAASIAGLLLTTEALVSEVPEEKKPAAPMPGGHDMDY
jgi:chaperonin GroEL